MKTHAWSRALTYARIAVIATAFAVLVPASGEAAIAVTITWDRNPDPATIGYYVYYGTESHNYITGFNVGNTTSAAIYLPDPRDPTVRYFFAVQAYTATGERSQFSPETVFSAADAPTLRNPGNMTGAMGLSVAVQLSGTDPHGSTLTYSAASLPAGLLVSSNTGRISGIPTTAGNYDVTVAATNTAGVSATQLFTWTIVGPTAGGGTPGGTPPPSSGGIPGGGGSGSGIGTPPPSSGGNPGGGIGTPPPSSGGNPDGGPGPGTGGGSGNPDPVTPGEDRIPPTVRIISPPTDGTYRTVSSKIIVTGVASDNVGVVLVMWANDRGGAGTSLGTSSWATSPIDLKMGNNTLTITVSDAAGNFETITFTVTRYVDLENHLN